jgi:predicted O-linked N-acetylglucosamine transferase (SPINDLY family)
MMRGTIEDALRKGLEHHQAGRLDEAKVLYRDILDRVPDHADALHLLGVLSGQAGQTVAAIDLIGRALAINPAAADYHNNLGESYRRAGDTEAAIACFRRAIALKPELARAHANLGHALKLEGAVDLAIDSLRQAIALRPDDLDTRLSLGNTLAEAGRREDASVVYRQAIDRDPGCAAAYNNLGDALTGVGRPDDAIPVLRHALALHPDYPEAHYNLGCALRLTGQLDAAIAAFRRAAELKPDFTDAFNNLGGTLHQLGQLDAAISAVGRALEIDPEHALALNNLGNFLTEAGRLDEAVAAHRRAIALRPRDTALLLDLGATLRLQCRHDEAIAVHHRAIELESENALAHNNLGVALHAAGRRDEAAAAFHRAVALDPGRARAHSNLGCVLTEAGRIDEAIAKLDQAIALDPNLAEAYNNRANAHMQRGSVGEAVADLRRAVTAGTGVDKSASNILFAIHADPDYDAQAILAEHRRWAARFAAPLAPRGLVHANDRTPGRRLTIGFVSPDFREHPVGRLLLPLFAHHDHRHAEFIAYSDVQAEDAVTAELRRHADGWQSIVGRSDAEATAQIAANRIDILVDLALHTAHNRLLVFARKPAPVQVTMLGMPSTTGLETIDYRLTDSYLDPPGESDGDYTEQSVRLPHCFWCYKAAPDALATSALPAQRRGGVTFGCLNQPAKASRPALELWARILRSVPGARLVLHAPAGSHRDALRALFEAGGVSADRVEFVPMVPLVSYLERYHDIDLCLDPFPYNGGTTTLDALWMGVPVITLAGRTAVGRGGTSVLSNLGLTELIARSTEQYVAIAAAWAADLPRLARLRSELRRRMQSSVLMDGKSYAANVEAAFRQMWQTWCNA